MDFEPQLQPTRRPGFMSMLGPLTFLAQCFAASAEMLLHTRMGRRYPGAPGAAVIILIPVFTLFWQGYDVTPLYWYLGLYIFFSAMDRAKAAQRRRRGEAEEHSRYTGRPGLMPFLPRMDERTVKSTVEPVLVLIGAAIAMQWSEPLGWYLVFAASGMMVTVHLSLAHERTRQTDINDSYLEQKQLAEWFRESRNRR